MYYIEDNRKVYKLFLETLPDLRPEIKIELVCMDINLEKLGFVDVAPCVFKIDISKEELEKLVDELWEMLEYTFYFTEDDEETITDERYQYCVKYAWMHDNLEKALIQECTEHRYNQNTLW